MGHLVAISLWVAMASNQPVILLAGCDNTHRVNLSIDNVSGEDTAVIVGATLGNGGKYLVSDLTLRAEWPDGRTAAFRYRPVEYPSAIGGSLEPWLVPLPVGASYVIRVSASQFIAKSQAGGLGKRLTEWPAAELSFELALLTPEATPGWNTVRLFKVWRGVEALMSSRLAMPGDCR